MIRSNAPDRELTDDPAAAEDPLPPSIFDAQSFVSTAGSFLFHLTILLALALFRLQTPLDPEAVVIVSPAPEYDQPLEEVTEFVVSDQVQTEIGANALEKFDVAEASAATFAEIAEIANPLELEPTDLGTLMVNKMFNQPVAPQDRMIDRKGQVGTGTAGAAGAVDQITFEIMQAAEDRPTLVCWLFDQSGSLTRQRKDIRDRFDRIYKELGIVSEKLGRRESIADGPRVLTSIIGFGSDVKLYTETPTADLNEIQQIVDSMDVDGSGTERVFTAIATAADQYKSLRRNVGPGGPARNVMFVVVTDERGDDANLLEKSIDGCRKWGIPVYCIGVPAPFGREHTLVKYVDPDPKFDQSPQWAQVDQGPETFLPERLQLGLTADFESEPVLDSGFGPYGLTRLCYETGGIYFAVHPNRNVSREVNRGEIEAFSADIDYFFDPSAMARYRPDYLPPQEYVREVKRNPLRQALIGAAQLPGTAGLQAPQRRFVKRSEAQLAQDLTVAQQDAAALEPKLYQLAAALEPGMKARDEETSARWRAGFDLAIGTVTAQRVRTETYNAILAKAKRGMAFEDAKNNTWILEPSDEVSVGSKLEREAAMATEVLTRVVAEHPGTPWALLAKRELEVPIGWKWTETFTDLDPPKMGGGGNNNPNIPKDDQKKMLDRAPKRPVPKL